MCLTHSIQAYVKTGHISTLILFNIQGFFDNLHVDHLVHLFSLLRFTPHLCAWVQLFLTDQCITLTINRELTPELVLNHSTPQGSPLSPILSSIYLFLLLQLAEQWKFHSLLTYVNDGAIFATGPTYKIATDRAAAALHSVTEWLSHSGLGIDLDKTKYISFQPLHATPRHVGYKQQSLTLGLPGSQVLSVRWANSVQYLGIFLQYNLHWDTHTKTMAAWGHSTIQALQLLGNSVQGLDFHNWHKVYHTIVLPVLTFGSPVWSYHLPKGVIQTLQVAQNDAIWKIGSLFHTTPTDAAHHILAIPPIKFTLLKYRLAYQQHLTHLPPSSKVLRIMSSDQTAYHHPQYFPPTSLYKILPPSFPPFYLPSNTIWSHPRATCLSPEPDAVTTLMSTQLTHSTDIFIYPLPHPTYKASAYIIFQDGLAVEHGFHIGPDKVSTAVGTMIDAIQVVARSAPSCIRLFIHNQHALHCLFLLHKHRFLPEASIFTAVASVLLMYEDSSLTTYPFTVHLPSKKSKADPQIFPHTWPGPPQKNWNLAELRMLASKAHHTNPPSLKPKHATFAAWAQDPTNPLPICKWTHKRLKVPTSPTPADLILGALKLKQQHVFCACLQVFFKHCFSSSFSLHFHPTAGNTITCPCSDTPLESGISHPTHDSIIPTSGGVDLHADPSLDFGLMEGFLPHLESGTASCPTCDSIIPTYGGTDLHADPSPGFRCLMEEFLHPETPSSGREASVHPGPLRKIHSPEHILLECPLTKPYRYLICNSILRTVNVRNLFYTIKGTESLVTFLLCSNSLLYPLPPQPDPP